MIRVSEVLAEAKAVSDAAHGGSNADALGSLLGLRDEDQVVRLVDAATVTLMTRAAEGGVSPLYAALHCGVELGVAAERLRARSVAA